MLVKYHGKNLLKKLLKLLFLLAGVFIAFEFAAGTQGVLDVDSQKGSSAEVFKSKVISSVSAVPKKVFTWLHILPKELKYDEIPKEVLEVHNDLEKRLVADPENAKNDYWRLSKVKETAVKYDLSEDDVMAIYVKVKTANH